MVYHPHRGYDHDHSHRFSDTLDADRGLIYLCIRTGLGKEGYNFGVTI